MLRTVLRFGLLAAIMLPSSAMAQELPVSVASAGARPARPECLDLMKMISDKEKAIEIQAFSVIASDGLAKLSNQNEEVIDYADIQALIYCKREELSASF